MSKELEALKFIFDEALFSEFKNETHTKVRECHSIVYEALQRLEAVDNAKPNEALDCLEELTDIFFIEDKNPNGEDITINISETEEFATIKQTLLKSQEQEKVLEIIKNKKPNLYGICLAQKVEQYNRNIFNIGKNRQLTEEEFDLLKRYFKI